MNRNGRNRLTRLLSVRDVSEATSIPATTLYDRIADGKIPAVRIGRSIRLQESDVLTWIESRREVAS